MKVVINVGHDRENKGASKKYCLSSESDRVYKYIEFNENDFNNLVALQLEELLNFNIENKIFIVQQCVGEYSKLPKLINELEPDICVSLHLNSYSKESANGTEVLYAEGSEKGKVLAQYLNEELKSLGLKNRGLKPTKRKNRGGLLLHKTYMPCVIVEPCFISNVRDFTVMLTSLMNWEYANKLFNGIKAYYESQKN